MVRVVRSCNAPGWKRVPLGIADLRIGPVTDRVFVGPALLPAHLSLTAKTQYFVLIEKDPEVGVAPSV